MLHAHDEIMCIRVLPDEVGEQYISQFLKLLPYTNMEDLVKGMLDFSLSSYEKQIYESTKFVKLVNIQEK